MTYNNLTGVIERLHHLGIPKPQLMDWRIMVGRLNGHEAPLLIGRMKEGVFSFAYCEIEKGVYLEDSLNAFTYDVRENGGLDNLMSFCCRININFIELKHNIFEIIESA